MGARDPQSLRPGLLRASVLATNSFSLKSLPQARPLRGTPVDPRYANHIDENPSYRVDFWTDDAASDEWRVEEAADINAVLAWAAAHANGRSAVIYVELSRGDGTIGLARVLGEEPT